MKPTVSPLSIVMDYYNYWSSSCFDQAESLLDEDLKVIVPINSYSTRKDFMNAVRFTRVMTSSISLLSTFVESNEVMLMYDMSLTGLGDLRVAEHFVVGQGKIQQVTQIHDTALFRK